MAEKTPLTMDEIKKIELNILKEYASFCDSHNLKYYLGYGTLLGAIRHKGFIPWDDDIDVLMPRPDYDKFIELTGFNPIKENLETRLYTKCRKPNIYPYAKVINTETLVYEKGKARKNISGIWIDVFPLDGYPEKKEDAQSLFERYLKLRHLQDLATTNPFYVNQNLIKKIIKTIFIAPFVKLYGVKRLCQKIDKLAQTYYYEEYQKLADFTWGDNSDTYILKTELEPSVQVDFENCKFKAPAGWEKYLERLYGNWQQLPPESDRIPHGFIAYRYINKKGQFDNDFKKDL